jgi:hypothetical protein
VPWRRLLKEYAIYAAIMAVVLLAVFRDEGVAALIGAVVVAGPIYLLLGYVMAKFGYQRKTLADLRTPRATTTGTVDTRTRPAPTSRTGARPRASGTRKRR